MSDPRVAAWRPFVETTAKLQTALDDDLKAHCGMSLSDYHILLILHECPGGRARMRDLAARMVFSSSRLSYQIDAMVRRGWLCREPVPEDRRGSYAVLVDGGREAFATASRHHATTVHRLFTSALTDADGIALAAIMTRLAENLDQVGEGGAAGRRDDVAPADRVEHAR
ncbi:MarR family transcriptional regulator [Gordonia sinesedis]